MGNAVRTDAEQAHTLPSNLINYLDSISDSFIPLGPGRHSCAATRHPQGLSGVSPSLIGSGRQTRGHRLLPSESESVSEKRMAINKPVTPNSPAKSSSEIVVLEHVRRPLIFTEYHVKLR